MRECGDCGLCCKLLSVNEIEKPAGVWCQHWKKGEGCTIHEERPEACKSFQCGWIQLDSVPDNLQPNKTKCFIGSTQNEGLVIYVDPPYPYAYREGKFGNFLASTVSQPAMDGKAVYVVIGDKRKKLVDTTPEASPNYQPNIHGTITLNPNNHILKCCEKDQP